MMALLYGKIYRFLLVLKNWKQCIDDEFRKNLVETGLKKLCYFGPVENGNSVPILQQEMKPEGASKIA
jgi:hypothetical protein